MTQRTTTPAARQWVHRTSEREVLPTGWTRLDDDRLSVSVRWPRDHRCFVPAHGRHDALLIAETMRQSTMLPAHAEFGVPLGHHFVMRSLEYTAQDVERLALDAESDDIDVVVTCSGVQRRGGRLSGMRTEHGSPCWITAGPVRPEAAGLRAVRISGNQDELVFRAALATPWRTR